MFRKNKKDNKQGKVSKRQSVNSGNVDLEKVKCKPLVDCNALVAPMRIRPTRVFPDRMRTKLVFVEQINIASATAVYAYSFYGNNVYDPDYTGTGGQPPWFDTLITIYNQFYVHKSKILVDVAPVSGGTMLNIGVYPTRNRTVTAITYDDAASFWRASSGLLQDFASGSAQDVHLYTEATTDEVYGQPLTITNSNFAGGVAGGPTNTWFWNMYFAQSQGGSNIKCSMKVTIELDVECFAFTNLADY